jgi:hypothetical protein
MLPAEVERLHAHLTSVREMQPVASAIDKHGVGVSGDVVSFGAGFVVVRDPITKTTHCLDAARLQTLRVIAIHHAVETFGERAGETGDPAST